MTSASASSTQSLPDAPRVPHHVAIIMDGNGRWATKRFLPRVAGHKRGVEAVREAVRACIERGIGYLTLFAFSSENWRRPEEEVSVLMQLFVMVLDQEVAKLHANGVRLKVVGDLSRFDTRLQALIERAHQKTEHNRRLTLTICANYGGRWDILQATQAMLRARPDLVQALSHPRPAGDAPQQDAEPALACGLAEADFAPYLSMAYAPEPDLFIRTGGEQRISNFLVWQLAYTELWFTESYWPDFDERTLDEAIASYQQRERRFGRTSEQVREAARQVISLPGSPLGSKATSGTAANVDDLTRADGHAVEAAGAPVAQGLPTIGLKAAPGADFQAIDGKPAPDAVLQATDDCPPHATLTTRTTRSTKSAGAGADCAER